MREGKVRERERDKSLMRTSNEDIENFERATHQTPFLWEILKVNFVFSSEFENFKQD